MCHVHVKHTCFMCIFSDKNPDPHCALKINGRSLPHGKIPQYIVCSFTSSHRSLRMSCTWPGMVHLWFPVSLPISREQLQICKHSKGCYLKTGLCKSECFWNTNGCNHALSSLVCGFGFTCLLYLDCFESCCGLKIHSFSRKCSHSIMFCFVQHQVWCQTNNVIFFQCYTLRIQASIVLHSLTLRRETLSPPLCPSYLELSCGILSATPLPRAWGFFQNKNCVAWFYI